MRFDDARLIVTELKSLAVIDSLSLRKVAVESIVNKDNSFKFYYLVSIKFTLYVYQ